MGVCSMKFFKWLFLVSFAYASMVLSDSKRTCDPNDIHALLKFVGNLTDESTCSTWSEKLFCCNWDGVSCGNGNGPVSNRVTMLALPGKGLKGIISSSLGRLDQLKSLDLSHNRLEGELPAELSKLQQLEVLDLSYNMLSGPFRMLDGALAIGDGRRRQ